MTPRIGRWPVILLTAAVGVAAGACGATAPSASVPPPNETAAPSASITTRPPTSLPVGVVVDPGLLEVLPPAIDGVPLDPDPTTAAQIATDPVLAESAISIAVALAVGVGTSTGDDLAVASVIRLRPEVFDEAFYQSWRVSYNEGACDVADGVESERESEIGGRVVYVGTCSGGVRTYHTYLEEQGFIVSITATGERRFGELILVGLAG